MIINYNKWFYDQHKYLTGSRNGVEGYVDTKWVDFNTRYRKLIDSHSSLVSDQPLIVYGNKYGFDQLIDLMAKSNYTFDDLDDALSDTYKMSLQNAMSRNVVNTHAIIYHSNNKDRKTVTPESFSHYRIIDVPFDQMHFGPRDEFIRQKLQEMHTKANDKYINIFSFNTSPIGKILDFTIICTVNGRISNDCSVAIDDKGFKFKVGWPWDYDVDFIIYKLDHSYCYNITVESSDISGLYHIPYSKLTGIKKEDVNGRECIINIYDPRFLKTIPSVPNFGYFDDNGLRISNLQKETTNIIESNHASSMNMMIYIIKYFNEVPNLYPAVNYYDILDERLVYDERYERIMTADGERVVAASTVNTNYLTTCTPPIVLDRDMTYSFTVLMDCVNMHDSLMAYDKLIRETGSTIMSNDYFKFNYDQLPALKQMLNAVRNLYNKYQSGAILTSLIPNECLVTFANFISNLGVLCTTSNKEDMQQNSFDTLYELNYRTMVDKITAPFFNNKSTEVFLDMGKTNSNFYNEKNSTRFTRPVSEQCFITLKYDHDTGSWIFACPEIKHFSGIGNTFYVDTELDGNELFKFFVLYTDTEAPATTNVSSFSQEVVFDYDKFVEEARKYIGCIRYWDAENKLLKMSRIMYNKYSDETCTYVLSKILKRKVDGYSILKQYPSEMNYEESNGTSDNVNDYTEKSVRGPFSINFMFYTLSMLNDNEDRLQAYFYNALTDQKFDNRYNDIDISSVINVETGYPINYSQYYLAPAALDPDSDNVYPSEGVSAYYTLPFIVDTNGANIGQGTYNFYRYTFNVYDTDVRYPGIADNSMTNDRYASYTQLTGFTERFTFADTIRAGKIMTEYLRTLHDTISHIQTNYRTTYNVTSEIESADTTINNIINSLNALVERGNITDQDVLSNISLITTSNAFLEALTQLQTYINDSLMMIHDNRPIAFISFINRDLLGMIKQVYLNDGFNNAAYPRVRQLYIHLKKINTPMNTYQYLKWYNEIDMITLSNLDQYMSDRGKDTYGPIFSKMYDEIINYYDEGYNRSVPSDLSEVMSHIRYAIDNLYMSDHINPIIQTVLNIKDNMVFDLYAISNIEYDASAGYNSKPAYVVIEIPGDETRHIIMQPITDFHLNKYIITSLSNICEYTFFDGEQLVTTMDVLDINGTVIGTSTAVLNFTKVSSTAEEVNTFNILPNMLTTTLEFENGHESFEVVDNLVVNEKHADMNYELLSGNRFLPLDHEIEYILEPVTWLQGSIDRIHINNQWLNSLMTESYSHNTSVRMFFKPSQVLHLNPYPGKYTIESVNGKYFEGQTIYLKSDDTVFPVKITAVDHSINKGFVEAVVDSWNADWFEITDPLKIATYMTSPIECTVVDDNISNFLDEFSDTTKGVFFDPGPPEYPVYDTHAKDCYSLPGDPIYVSSHADYVYTRLKWMFSDLVPNRFIDEAHKTHRFIYLTNGFILDGNDELKINMINHDFNTMSLPEEYPVLRDEPNDHTVWDAEIKAFTEAVERATDRKGAFERLKQVVIDGMKSATTKEKYNEYLAQYEDIVLKIKALDNRIGRWTRNLRQLEFPSTWFNVVSYDAALVYIDNGRANQFSPVIVHNVRDAIYTDELGVYIYDWEHKHWLDPSTYTITKEIVDDIRFDEYDNYDSKQVLCSITITPETGFVASKSLLIYLSYDQCDVFDSITMGPDTCSVRFKPLLTMEKPIDDYEPYADIRIRKHFDGFEKYTVNSNDIHVKRVRRTGKFIYAPSFRVCDLKFEEYNNGELINEYDFNDINKFYVKSDFEGLRSYEPLVKQSFSATINTPFDGFNNGDHVKLIAISNNESSSYDGNISTVMFEGDVSGTELNPTITITKSTLPGYASGTFICTVFQDDRYDEVGGVITVRVIKTSSFIYDDWFEIPKDYLKYHEIPNEFKVTLTANITSDTITVILEDKYLRDIDDTIIGDNSNLNNPFEYYYNGSTNVRLPISDTRINANDKRLVVDQSINESVNIIKAPYIGICRYSLANIPEDGLIDLTGYIPTPLSRKRYEFWVNGRFINNTDKLTILSPTSVQLSNLTSLKNFEVIELVDDMYRNDVIREGNLYTDINGNTYSSYKLALLANTKIRKQSVKFVFNANVHSKINDYTRNIIEMPNNRDLEDDILDSITFDDSNNDYNKLKNIPSFNGVPIFHPNIQDLGINEIPTEKIIEKFDEVWRIEEVTNPVFMMTHRDLSGYGDPVNIKLHVKMIDEEHWSGVSIDTSNMMLIYATGPIDKYFSLYISNLEDGVIDDVNNTAKIIPFITPGIYILIDKSYQGLWLHSTDSAVKPIKLE